MEYPDFERVGNFLDSPSIIVTTPAIDVKYGWNADNFMKAIQENSKNHFQDWINQQVHYMIMRAKNIPMSEAIEIAVKEKPPLLVYNYLKSDKPQVCEYKLIQ